MTFVACRLIPLDKWPRVRPIGIGDVPQQIVAKVILYVIGGDVVSAAGPLQACAGHAVGSEAAVQAMREMFEDTDFEAALFVDASNVFNCVNCQAALHKCFLNLFLLFFKTLTVLLFVCLLLVRGDSLY